MRVFIEFRSKGRGAGDAGVTIDSELAKFKTVLVRDQYWDAVIGDDFDTLVDQMAERLPPEDLLGFAKNVRIGLRLLSPSSQLTIGGFIDESTVVVRIRLMASNDAVLVSLGERIGNAILAQHKEYDLTRLVLWRDRKHEDVLSGKMEVVEAVGFGRALARHKELAIPWIIAIAFLIAGAFVADRVYGLAEGITQRSPTWLGEAFWGWYLRLSGPMLMAAVTTSAGVVVWLRQAGSRHVSWQLEEVQKK